MSKEKSDKKEHASFTIIRPMQPDDFKAWMQIASNPDFGAWPDFSVNEEHDFVALVKDTNTSPAVFEGNRMIGASLNIIKYDPTDKEIKNPAARPQGIALLKYP